MQATDYTVVEIDPQRIDEEEESELSRRIRSLYSTYNLLDHFVEEHIYIPYLLD